jgi:ABC-2 type transport system ATP-binding protein
MIEVSGLTKYYARTLAIEDVTFTVNKGEIVGFLGPNGAGKTTTMRIITGYLAPTSGKARVGGCDVFTHSREARRMIGYVPESLALYNDMRVREYLGFFSSLRGVPRKQRRARVQHAMEQAHIAEVADTIIGKLSKGYRQRVGLAQAIAHDPQVLVMDEPTLGLDPRQTSETRQLIKGLGSERTVILSTHILPEVEMICDRVVIISKGQVVAVDTADELRARLRKSEKTLVRMRPCPASDAKEAAEELSRLPDVVGVTAADMEGAYIVESQLGRSVAERVAELVVNRGWGLLELRPVSMTLEDVFLELTMEEKE